MGGVGCIVLSVVLGEIVGYVALSVPLGVCGVCEAECVTCVSAVCSLWCPSGCQISSWITHHFIYQAESLAEARVHTASVAQQQALGLSCLRLLRLGL